MAHILLLLIYLMTIFDEQYNRIYTIIRLVSAARVKNDRKIMSDAMRELDAFWQKNLQAEAD